MARPTGIAEELKALDELFVPNMTRSYIEQLEAENALLKDFVEELRGFTMECSRCGSVQTLGDRFVNAETYLIREAEHG